MTPEEAVFRQIYKTAEGIYHNSVFDYLPNAETRYPFIFIEYGTNTEQINNDLIGYVRLNVHFYGTLTDRNRIDDFIFKLHQKTEQIPSGFGYRLKRIGWNTRVLPEPPDEPKIVHRLVELQIEYTKRS